MGIELHAQRIQASFRELPFQSFATELTCEIALVITVGQPRANYDPIDEPGPKEHATQGVRKEVNVTEYRPLSQAEQRLKSRKNVDKERCVEEAQKKVGRNALAKLRSREWQAQVYRKNEEGEKSPRPPQGKRREQNRAPTDGRV